MEAFHIVLPPRLAEGVKWSRFVMNKLVKKLVKTSL